LFLVFFLVTSFFFTDKRHAAATARGLNTADLDDLLNDLEAEPVAFGGAAAGAAVVPRININPEPARPISRPVSRPTTTTTTTTSSSSSSSSYSPSGPISNWTLDNVIAQLGNLNVTDASIRKFRDEKIDGRALVMLSENDLKEELTLPLGDRKKVSKLIQDNK
jgi:hypothetical protein